MKRLFYFAIIIVLLLSVISSYAQQSQGGYDKILDAFKKTNSNFEGYNINGHVKLDNKFLSFEEIDKIVNEINKSLGVDLDNLEYTKTDDKNLRQVYTYFKNDEKQGISVKVDSEKCENMEETHITVDINNYQVYKDIVKNYLKLKNILKNYSRNVDIFSCIIGSFKEKVDKKCYNSIANNIFSNLNAVKKEEIQDENILSVTGYTSNLNDYISYGGNKINLNVSLRYSEYDDKTFIYIGTPLIVLEY
ncbi:YwmB family TATA-box binding protein [Tepidibacter thalassicus]|uniref:TATA-box binding n=1 Tax=Tepidibacter thalassicus DSM 15285 TaxID=1123350 RepID=A0A1M5R192_9FIRM|nr:YwmB family TATA-box binding protein [Tepidibacter thalassicus]SHH19553.1 TATA-box binding [Tepidibacter thalassicus DSM 15285]